MSSWFNRNTPLLFGIISECLILKETFSHFSGYHKHIVLLCGPLNCWIIIVMQQAELSSFFTWDSFYSRLDSQYKVYTLEGEKDEMHLRQLIRKNSKVNNT